MSGTCEYKFDPEDPGSWNGDEYEDCYLDRDVLNDDGVWACPHDTETGEEFCIFHRPVDDKDDADAVEALADALDKTADGSRESGSERTSEFIGARFGRVEIESGTVIESRVRFDHASIAGGFVAEDVDFERGMSANGATFESENRNRNAWPPLEDAIGDDHHDRFPSVTSQSDRHVSFCGASFGGDVTFDGAVFKGNRHVSLAHTDFGGDSDVSFTEVGFENEGHVAFNKSDFGNRGDISFEDAEFQNFDVSFSVVDFENDGDVSFEDATFRDCGDVALHDTDFVNPAGVSFTDVTIKNVDEFDFRGSTFTEDVDIKITATASDMISFRDVDFSRATLDIEPIPEMSFESTDLTGADLSGMDLSGTNLEGAVLNLTNLYGTCFADARLDGTVFGDAQVNERTFEELASDVSTNGGNRDVVGRLMRIVRGPTGEDSYRCVYDPAGGSGPPATDGEETEQTASTTEADSERNKDDPTVRAGRVYRQFERLAADNALPKWQRRFFILRQDMQKRQKTGVDRWFALIQQTVFGYGESFGRVFGWAIGIVAAFAVTYLTGGWIYSVGPEGTLGQPVAWSQVPDDPMVLWESLYYSALTFTGLGFGDFRPVSTVGQLLTVLESVSGALLLALLVFVLGRRAAR